MFSAQGVAHIGAVQENSNAPWPERAKGFRLSEVLGNDRISVSDKT